MNEKKIVEKIIERWNSGDIKGARRLFLMGQMFLGEKTKCYFEEKFKTTPLNENIKYACDIMGGKITDEFDNVIYEKNIGKTKEGTSQRSLL